MTVKQGVMINETVIGSQLLGREHSWWNTEAITGLRNGKRVELLGDLGNRMF